MKSRVVICIRLVLGISLALILFFHVSFSSLVGLPTLRDPNLKIELVSGGLKFPSGIAFLDVDDLLVLEKNTGVVKRIVNNTFMNEPVLDIAVASKGERGLLGIAINRNESNHVNVFLYYTESSGQTDGEDVTINKEPLGNRVYRYDLTNNTLVSPKLLLDISATTTSKEAFHNGGKIAIGPDNNLYISVGNMERNSRTQNNKTGADPDGSGGILRISQDGKPVDSKKLGEGYPLNLYYAYGIRNSFGMDFDPVTGILWDTENGPTFDDEINLVEPGFNSGARTIYGMVEDKNEVFQPVRLEYFNGTGVYSNPEFVWEQTVGPTGLKFLESSKLGPEYQNTLFVGDVNNGNLYNFRLDEARKQLVLQPPLNDNVANNKTELENVIFGTGFGGIIDVETSPDGFLYILSIKEFNQDNQGTLYKIGPKIP